MAPPPLRLAALLLLVAVFSPAVRADLVISRADRKVDLTSHIVRVLTLLKVENVGPEPVSNVLLAFPNIQAKNLAAIRAFGSKGKVKGLSTVLPIEVVQPSGAPPELTFFSVSLHKALEKGKILHLDALTVFTHSLQPFPEEIGARRLFVATGGSTRPLQAGGSHDRAQKFTFPAPGSSL